MVRAHGACEPKGDRRMGKHMKLTEQERATIIDALTVAACQYVRMRTKLPTWHSTACR